ncbi:hypothetical protein ACFQ3R_04115 [Mesonia ostreae]|uniref:Polysaccharide chain length determinant N-terminal domain-containing protein n=1 Tax=Mesonia ostreae TaxID=861110 RepID=A0ABU2KIX2_9FLAO|nr:hypothetical protein [Mesonia ostreae]MDT0294666.1 hypothetical protein [Mesonia ostreae]
MSDSKNNEEIDLFDLFRMVKNGFNSIGNAFLRLIQFLLKYSIVLISIIIVGLIVGYFWNQQTKTYYQIEALVAASDEGSSYLYKKIDEVNFALSTKNKSWQKELETEAISSLSLQITPVYITQLLGYEEKSFLQYLDETNLLDEKAKTELIQNKVSVHRVTLKYSSEQNGEELFQKVFKKLRENAYFTKVYAEKSAYLEQQVVDNKKFIASLDELIATYSQKNESATTGVIVNGANFDFDGLISQRSELQRETRDLISEKIKHEEFLKVIDLGSSKPVHKKPFLQKNKMLVAPILLLIGFSILYVLIVVLKKARALKE